MCPGKDWVHITSWRVGTVPGHLGGVGGALRHVFVFVFFVFVFVFVFAPRQLGGLGGPFAICFVTSWVTVSADFKDVTLVSKDAHKTQSIHNIWSQSKKQFWQKLGGGIGPKILSQNMIGKTTLFGPTRFRQRQGNDKDFQVFLKCS